MKKIVDNRSICSEAKKASIAASRFATTQKRQNQIVKVYECKIVEKRLNKKQKEELKLLFVEGKWFYNHVLSIHQNRIPLTQINSTDIKTVKHFDKDKNVIESELKQLKSQQKQAIIARMVSNEKTILTLIKNGIQKHGSLRFKSEFNCIPLKQYGNTYKFISCNKIKIAGISGSLLLKTGNQLKDVDEFANANLIKKQDGYYLKITTFTDKNKIKTIKTNNREIGLDFGIKNNLTTSNDDKFNLSIEESEYERIKKLQRELFRRIKGSNNRHKTINLIRREYQKISNKKQDKVNQLIAMLKPYSCIVMQDECLAKWHIQFGKQLQHSCLGLLKTKIKALPQTIVLDKYIPTTKLCPKCQTINNYMTLADRIYRCGCGYELDRDIHAAKNMLAIKKLVFKKNNFVPTEHREVTLMEFKAAVDSDSSKSISLNKEVRIAQELS